MATASHRLSWVRVRVMVRVRVRARVSSGSPA